MWIYLYLLIEESNRLRLILKTTQQTDISTRSIINSYSYEQTQDYIRRKDNTLVLTNDHNTRLRSLYNSMKSESKIYMEEDSHEVIIRPTVFVCQWKKNRTKS